MTIFLHRIDERWPPVGGTVYVRPVSSVGRFSSDLMPVMTAKCERCTLTSFSNDETSAMHSGLGDTPEPTNALTST